LRLPEPWLSLRSLGDTNLIFSWFEMASEAFKSKRRVALVTGARGGLGNFVTCAFGSAGYGVSAIDLKRAGASEPNPPNLFLEADLSLPSAAEAAVQDTSSRLGPIDCLVHLVGAFTGGLRVEETPEEVWDEMLRVNLRTAINMLRAVIPLMRSRKKGRIIVVGSSAALHPVVTWGAFSVAMSGLATLIRVTAAELLGTGITLNGVLPTTIDTPAVRAMTGDIVADRAVSPESLASLILWLCSDAGADVTGALLPVTGQQPHPCYQWHEITDRTRSA
jgi:NAD(P)-dependent dehydrogenase (short-subunit alcohol dehydrogenase family)